MSLKARINRLEESIKPKSRSSKERAKESWKEQAKRHEEMNKLEPLVYGGDLKACIRYCELCPESLMERTYKYRDSIIKIAGGDIEERHDIDIWNDNLKATYQYLKARAIDPHEKEPVLTVYQAPRA